MTKPAPAVTPDRILFEVVKLLLQEARRTVARNINTAMVLTYFEIGRMIVENEQQGKARADYAKETLKNLSRELGKEFGKGFSERNLENIRNFYLCYSKQISQTASAKSEKLSHISPATFPLKMYVNYYDRFVKSEDENSTIGIILCKDKTKSMVEISLPESNDQIFAQKYQLYLPSKEELKKQLEDSTVFHQCS